MIKLNDEEKNNIHGGLGVTAIWVIVCGVIMGISTISNIINQSIQTATYSNAVGQQNEMYRQGINTTNFNISRPIYNEYQSSNSNGILRFSPLPLRSSMSFAF